MNGRRCVNLLLPGALLTIVALVYGCSAESRHRFKTIVFEGVPPAGEQAPPPEPYVRQPRRQPPYTPPPPVMVKVSPYKAAFQYDWKSLLKELPKDDAGGIDWVTALESGQIEPRSGTDPDNPGVQAVLPLDVQLEPKDMPMFKVTFPHKPHTEWLACDNCHTKIFQMQAGADPITMDKIFAGQYCGTCHGKVAFDVKTGCPRCHLALAGPR